MFVPFAPKLLSNEHERASALILRDLIRAGWNVYLEPPSVASRDEIRAGMDEARKEKVREVAPFMLRMRKGGVKALLAQDVDASVVRPYLQLCSGRDEWTGLALQDVWRYMRLSFWANPYERAPGRCLLYLIRDVSRTPHAVMGLLGLSNCLLQLTCREEFIRWPSQERKRECIGRHMAEASTVGAVPPYNALRAGKLSALLALSDEVRADWKRRYKDELVYLGTTALYPMKPNQYTRCNLPCGLRWKDLGYTEGYGTNTFGAETASALTELVQINGAFEKNGGARTQNADFSRRGFGKYLEPGTSCSTAFGESSTVRVSPGTRCSFCGAKKKPPTTTARGLPTLSTSGRLGGRVSVSVRLLDVGFQCQSNQSALRHAFPGGLCLHSRRQLVRYPRPNALRLRAYGLSARTASFSTPWHDYSSSFVRCS